MSTDAPTAPPPPPPSSFQTKQTPNRDFLHHLESYLARRDGVDKLLKISRYAAKLALAIAPNPSSPAALRLKSFESSVGLSRKAFRLGKFIQDLNSLRSAPHNQNLLLSILAYGGEGIYYFLEQFIWLSKTGLLPPEYSRKLQKYSALAELAGYFGSVALKAMEVRMIWDLIRTRTEGRLVADCEEEIRKLRVKLVMKQMSIVQDFADALMALGDVLDGKGVLGEPMLVALAGLVSAVISAHKNWSSC